ncbi:MAG TPA: flagellar basal-body MS-ring/collar protein FliF [Rhodocyclaceae bacterium]|nr:flagellar basal-body MS-ring/collar protein FliF [Rhodocyclaceae bacterium]
MAAEDALAPPSASPFQVIGENLARMTQRQKLAGAIVIAIAIAVLVGIWSWSTQTQYAVLFSNVAEKDGGAIITALQQQNVPYKVEGTTILVPYNRANELRLTLASQGLPKGGLVGFELMDTQKFGMSQFNEQINYQRALEGELARTIQSLSAVNSARVHLAIPKQTAFLRDEEKPTASVVITLNPGRKLEPQQIAGVVHLVSSSVPELAPDQVSVIDQDGNLLTHMRDQSVAGLDSSQLEYISELEDTYIKRIQTILEPMLGAENFRAQVMADVDFDASEQTSETFKPNPAPNTAIRSQQTSDNQTNQPPAIGVPGALSNQPPVPATAPITSPVVAGAATGQSQPVTLTSSKSSTTNYELDKTIQHVKRSIGSVKRLSVAVLLNFKTDKSQPNAKPAPLTNDEMKKISDLVRQAVGYNQTRGDTINLANSAFATEGAKEEDNSIPLWQNPEYIAIAKEALRYLALLAAIAFVGLGVVRPLLRGIISAAEASAEAQRTAAAKAHAAKVRESDELDDDDIPPEILEAELAKMTFDKKVARARRITEREPKMVAHMIKEWLAGGTSNG